MSSTKKEILSWSLYDFANSAYAVLIPVLLFPLYYKTIILNNNPNADLWWGIAAGLSVLLAGLVSPLVGALADVTKRRKLFFIISSIIAIFGTATLAITSNFTPLIATIIFILTNMTYNSALTLYDSLLFNVSSRETSGKISNFGWAMGYLGGLICLILVYPFIKGGVNYTFYWLSFIIVATFYFIFALPSFIYLKETELQKLEKIKNPIRTALKNIFETFKNWKAHKHLFLFLLAFYFFTEGIVTLTFFFSLYANTTLNASISQIAIMFIITQIIAIPITILIGKYSYRFGYRNILILTIVGWCLATILLTFAKTIGMLYVFTIFTGFIVGGSQATARAWYNNLVPQEKRSEFFGFNALASKVSATIGPALFGFISVTAGSQRIALISVLFYFVVSLILFARIKSIHHPHST